MANAYDTDDESIFITQNTFRNNVESDLDDNVDAFLDIFENSRNITQILDENAVFSDENDYILLQASQLAQDENNNAKLISIEKSETAENVIDKKQDIKIPYRLITEPITDSEDDKPEKRGRFHFVNEGEVQQNSKKRYADSTETKIKWAVQLFSSWKKARNKVAPVENMSVIVPKIEEMTTDELNYSLSRFIQEVRKENNEEYPGKTLKEIILSLQMHINAVRNITLKFLEDNHFTELKNSLDNIMKNRAKNGIGTKCKQAEVISLEEEEQLWECSALGSEDPKTLVQTVFYLLGLNFALRGGQEHRDLCAGSNSQFTLGVDSDGLNFLQYQEDFSKCHSGGLKHVNLPRKNVKAYENFQNSQRCLLKLYNLYLSHCPIDRPDAFYLRPLVNPTTDVWYSRQPMGYHKLRTVVKDICERGQITGYRTNHLLCATTASRLYTEGIDEQAIQEVTGHRSVAVRSYKRTPSSLKRKVSAILSGSSITPNSTAASSSPQQSHNVAIETGKSSITHKTPNTTIVVNVNI